MNFDHVVKKIADGLTSKLNFDFSCNRGHYFGEHYVHGAVNEIIASNIDPHKFSLRPSFARPTIQRNARQGRPREVDFAIEKREDNLCMFVLELKWIASSYSTATNILFDLHRLQNIKNGDPRTVCALVISGPESDFRKRFNSEFLRPGSGSLLHFPASGNLTKRKNGRKKVFSLRRNKNWQEKIDGIFQERSIAEPFSDSICTKLVNFDSSAPATSRFHTYAWHVCEGV